MCRWRRFDNFGVKHGNTCAGGVEDTVIVMMVEVAMTLVHLMRMGSRNDGWVEGRVQQMDKNHAGKRSLKQTIQFKLKSSLR